MVVVEVIITETDVDCLVMVVVQVGHYRDRCGLFSDCSGSGRSLSQKGMDCLVIVVVQVG